MKNMMRFVSLALVIVSLLAIAAPAFAAATITLDVKPGKNPRTAAYTFSNTASFTSKCTLADSNDTIRIFLDVFCSDRNDWVQRKSYNFTSDGSKTLTYAMQSTDTEARIRTYGYKENAGTGTVVVTVNN